MDSRNLKIQIAKIKNIPPLSEEGKLIITAVNDPEISMDDLISAISHSPVLVARLLGLANSAYFGRSDEIKDIRIAIIQVLGLNMVKSLAMSLVLNAQFEISACTNFNSQRYWSTALMTANMAQRLCQMSKVVKADCAFLYTSGLLFNIGLMAAVYLLPKHMGEVFSLEQESELPLHDRMYALIGMNQYAIGARLLHHWQLPESYQTILTNAIDTNAQAPQTELNVLVSLAAKISGHVYRNHDTHSLEITEEIDILNISNKKVEQQIQTTLEKLEDLKELASAMSGK